MMTVARLHGLKDLRVDTLEIPTPGVGEALLKVHACSVCGSDIRIFHFGNDRLRYPCVPGHEIGGEVVAVGEGVKALQTGDRVAVGADVPSMEDDWGKNGIGNLSNINYAIGYQFPGGFAQYCLLNALTVQFGPVTKIPAHMSYEEATLAEPLACCLNGLERGFCGPGKTVLIIGAGPVGILLYITALAFGASLVVLADKNEKRIAQAKELGIEHIFNSNFLPLEKLDKRFPKDRQGFDLVLTACSSADAQEEALKVVAKRGVVNLFGGLPANSRPISFYSNAIHYKEAYITGSHGSTPLQHKLAVNLITSGKIKVLPLISHCYPLARIHEAFRAVETQAGFKITIKPWS